MTAYPVFFGGADAPLFAWYHPPLTSSPRRVAVVLCPPIALDFMSSYRSLRILAERLAQAGFAVLRLEYRGTGNAAGGPRDPGHVGSWEDSIASAAEEASRRAGTDQLVLVGLRLGGTLAARAARRIGASDALVLWSPLPSGKAYLRELRALVALSGADGYAEVDGEISAAGFLLTRESAEELEALDLMALPEAPASHILLLEEDDRSSTRRLAARFGELGGAVTYEQLPGTASMLPGANYAVVPLPILERITAWLEGRYPALGPGEASPGRARTTPVASPTASSRERTIAFGPDERLFGLLSEPAAGRARVAVIFLNTGCNHHVGPHRMFVALARDCAELGVAALRFDFGGLGASRPPPGAAENVPYPAHAIEDVQHAIEAVRRETGAARVILAGMCSGGWHAVHAARAGLAIDAVLAVNPPLYFKGGDPEEAKKAVEAVAAVEAGELLRYRRSMLNPEKWKKLLRGGVQVGAFARLAVTQGWRLARTKLLPSGSTTAAELEELTRARFPVLFVFDREDPSYLHFEQHLPRRVRREGGSLRWVVIEGAGDTFKPIAAQRRLREILLDLLKRETA